MVRYKSKVREARVQKGLTQKKLAELVGVCAENIQQIEYERREPSVVTAIRIARVLGKPVEELFEVEDAG